MIFVGTWSLDQTLLWTQGTNATTGEHVDLSDLTLVGAQGELVQSVVSAMNAAGKKSVVVFVSGKPVAEPWIQEHAGAVVQQFYPGELVCAPFLNPQYRHVAYGDIREVWLFGRFFSVMSTRQASQRKNKPCRMFCAEGRKPL